MIIRHSEISEREYEHIGTEPGSLLGIKNDPFIKINGDIDYNIVTQHIADELIFKGTLTVHLELQCSRCADFFSTTLTDSDFLRVYPASQDSEFIDLTEDIREDLLLCLPGFPICNEDCKGLCTKCGKALNKETCSCNGTSGSDAWQALDNIDL